MNTWFLCMTGLAIQDEGNIFRRNFGITTRCCSAQAPQNYHFVFRMVRKRNPRLRHLMSVLQAPRRSTKTRRAWNRMWHQVVRCANENQHGRPITGELSGIKSKDTSVQTCSVWGILWFTQWVADDSVFLGHDFASMANGIPTFRESVVSSSSRVETSYIFNFRTQMTLKLPLCATIHKHRLACFRSCRFSDRLPQLVTIYETQFRITNLKFYSYSFSRGLHSECVRFADNLIRQNR
jgi:hypothetical protein